MKIPPFLLFVLFTMPAILSAETLIINDPNDVWLNLRSGPGTTFRIIQRMDNGLRVEELERKGNWSNIALPNGVIGWSYRDYMRPVNPASSVESGASKDRWSYADGEAGWDLIRNGELVARVFLGRDFDTGDFYYGFYRVSSDPMIHFMGVSIAHSDGRESELEADGCYARNCLTEYEGGDGIASAQVRIPIRPGDQARILEEFQSGKDITFRYQSAASYADDSFKRMRLSLKGSRHAIDELRSKTRPGEEPMAEAEADSPVQSASAAASVAGRPVTPTGSGQSYIVNETRNGDNFCDAPELDEYPRQINAPEMEWIGNTLLTDEYSVKYVNPVSLDFVARGTTVWRQFPGNSNDTILYANGAAVARGQVIQGSNVFHGPRWEGSWQHEEGLGLMIRLKSIERLSWGHEYYECTHGLLTDSRSSGIRPTTDSSGNSVMKQAVWRGCSFWIHCNRWTDEHPEKKSVRNSGYLVEWSESQIAPDQLRWKDD